MTGLTYLAALVVSLASVVAMDIRWRLFFWSDTRRAAVVLGTGFAFFLAWDLTAIELGLYERGRSRFMTGVEVVPDLPVEELLFLVFLPYLTMVLHGLVGRLAARRMSSPEPVRAR